MQHKRQSYNACLAYALWQIGVVEEKAVKCYERDKSYENLKKQASWVNDYVPELNGKLIITPTTKTLTGHSPLTGKGIIQLYNTDYYCAHAISYENGVVLDPEQSEEWLSLEKYLEKYPRWKVVGIFPMEGKTK